MHGQQIAIPITFAAVLLLVGSNHAEAQLTWEKTTVEVTAEPDQKQVAATFKFTNGDRPTTIRSVKPRWHGAKVIREQYKSYRPGEAGTVTIQLPLRRSDLVMRIPVDVLIDAEENDRTTLMIEVRPSQYLQIKPRSVRWTVGGEAKAKAVTVTVVGKQPMALKVVGVRQRLAQPRIPAASDGDQAQPNAQSATTPEKQDIDTDRLDFFEVKLSTVEEGRVYQLTVTPKAVDHPVMAMIRLGTDDKQRHRGPGWTVFASVVAEKPKPRAEADANDRSADAAPSSKTTDTAEPRGTQPQD